MKNYFVVKNLYNYEKVIAPPKNLDKSLSTVYITDNDENVDLSKKLGWNISVKTNMFINESDVFNRRKSVSYINAFPSKVVPELNNANFIFVCDSNIIKIWDEYNHFVSLCKDNHCLFVTSGYYEGIRDNIESECNASMTKRWSYNHNAIRNATERYKKELIRKGVNISKLSIVSAKYIGWNTNHPMYNELSNFYYKESLLHLQGNITLTYMSGIYNDFIYNYRANNYSNGVLNKHNYPA
jgi:hypothetical protein